MYTLQILHVHVLLFFNYKHMLIEVWLQTHTHIMYLRGAACRRAGMASNYYTRREEKDPTMFIPRSTHFTSWCSMVINVNHIYIEVSHMKQLSDLQLNVHLQWWMLSIGYVIRKSGNQILKYDMYILFVQV